jgi:hypothetical protein
MQSYPLQRWRLVKGLAMIKKFEEAETYCFAHIPQLWRFDDRKLQSCVIVLRLWHIHLGRYFLLLALLSLWPFFVGDPCDFDRGRREGFPKSLRKCLGV